MANGRSIWVRIFGDNSGLKKATKESEGVLDKFGNKVKQIGGLIAGAFAFQKIAAFAKESMNLANEMEGVEEAFNRISDQKALEKLREATKGTVTDLELMRRSVMASNFGISQSALPKLFEFATKRAQETGQSVDYLVDSIVTGLGRKSPLILDNLGITTIQLQEALGGTSMAAASVGELTEAAAKVAGEELTKMGEITETNAIRLEQLATQWTNLKTEIGKGISELWLEAVDSLVTDTKILTSEHLTLWEKLGSIGNPAMKIYAETMAEVRGEMEKIVEETDPATRLLARAAADRKAEAEAAAKAAAERARAEAEYQKEFKESLQTQGLYTKAIERRERLEKSTHDFVQDAAQKNIDALDKQIQKQLELEGVIEDVATVTIKESEKIGDAFTYIYGDLAQAFGEIATSGQSVEDAMEAVSEAVMKAIPDIMIAAGNAMGYPQGLALILPGLAMKGMLAGIDKRTQGMDRMTRDEMIESKKLGAKYGYNNRIKGNDIQTANEYSVDLYNQVG
jgi:hypothetical protein